MNHSARPRMLVIDRQASWRERYSSSLTQAGYDVKTQETYEFPLRNIDYSNEPDLVLLGCTKVSSAEMALIQLLVNSGHRLLVLSSTLSGPEMRELFRAGAKDVDIRSYDASQLIITVEKALRMSKYRDCYESVDCHGGSL